MIRTCADCQSPFSIEPEEEDWFRREGLTLPKRCPRCRGARRGVTDKPLTCARCGDSFIYPRALQLFARTYGWGLPRRCIGGCGGVRADDETEQERQMREVLAELHRARQRDESPPLELVLQAQQARRTRPRGPAVPSPDDLFAGLGAAGDDPPATEQALRRQLTTLDAQRRTPDDLFKGLKGAEDHEQSPDAGGRPRRRGKRGSGGVR